MTDEIARGDETSAGDAPGAEPGDEPGGSEPVSDLTLAEVLAASSEGLVEVSVDAVGTSTIWSSGGHPFAALDGDWAEFRLAPAIARAALRTPDAAVSLRGPDWVSFAPVLLDDPAIDRAEAWFLSAHRHATTPRD